MSEQSPQGASYDQLHLFGPGQAPVQRRPDAGKRRTALWLAISMVTVLVLGTGAVLAWRFWFGQGPQPAEALPANTVYYVSIDLDPSGQQKVEALKTLRKFPALRDVIGIGAEDDLREKVFGEIQSEGVCPDLDYGRDVAPWLGDRMGVGLIARDAGQIPEPVVVLQVTDEDKAETGVERLLGCDATLASEVSGHAFSGSWMVIARTPEIARSVVADAEEESLADADGFREWNDLVGDAGVINGYASPELGTVIEQMMRSGDFSGFSEEFAPGAGSPDEVPDEVYAELADFRGGAFAVRFDDGALEFESVVDGGNPFLIGLTSSGGAGDLLGSLPASTAGAIGLALPDDWWNSLVDMVGPAVEAETGMSVEELLADAEDETGLTLPEDLVTLLGEAVVIAVDGSIAEDFNDPEGFPVSVKIKGDVDAIRDVLDKLLATMGDVPIVVRTEGDHVLIGLDDAHLAQLAEDGDLGGEDSFRDVLPEAAKAASVFYVDFDAEDWLVRLAEGEPEVVENLEPLSGLGLAAWSDDNGRTHIQFRLTTD